MRKRDLRKQNYYHKGIPVCCILERERERESFIRNKRSTKTNLLLQRHTCMLYTYMEKRSTKTNLLLHRRTCQTSKKKEIKNKQIYYNKGVPVEQTWGQSRRAAPSTSSSSIPIKKEKKEKIYYYKGVPVEQTWGQSRRAARSTSSSSIPLSLEFGMSAPPTPPVSSPAKGFRV